jgi:hypothetical protein
MPKSKRSETEPLTGEVLPLAHVATTTLAEMSPEQFLALHGVKPPKPKAYRSFDEAIMAVIADVTKGVP